jgi:hypothetical protein
MEYQPVDHTDYGGGHEEWVFRFARHGLDCSVTVSSWPNGNWGWHSLIDARGLGVQPPPPLTEAERLSTGLYRPGPPKLFASIQLGGLFPNLSLPESLKTALEHIDDYYFRADNK